MIPSTRDLEHRVREVDAGVRAGVGVVVDLHRQQPPVEQLGIGHGKAIDRGLFEETWVVVVSCTVVVVAIVVVVSSVVVVVVSVPAAGEQAARCQCEHDKFDRG